MMTIDEIDAVELPPEIQAELDGMMGREPHATEGKLSMDEMAMLARLSGILVDKRKEAIDGRKQSGIEDIWAACEDAHESIDETNRGEIKGERWMKPLSTDGPLTRQTTKRDDNEQPRSNAFVPVTRRYVGAGHAKVCEILLPSDDKAFSVEPTPVPELIQSKDDTRQLAKPDGTLLTRDATKDEIAQDQSTASPQVPPASSPVTAQPPDAQLAPAAGGAPALPPGKPLTVRDLATEKLEQAEAAAKEAETQIQDWMTEGHYAREMRKVAFDAAKVGVGVVKSPYSVISRSIASLKNEADGSITAKIVEKVVPGSKRINPWHFYPDPSCGEDVQTGEYCWERDFITERTLKGLSKEDGYVEELIAQVVKEGPGKCHLDEKTAEMGTFDHRYEIWYFEGFLRREEILALNPKLKDDIKETASSAMMICTMVNDTVIRGVLHPLQSGSFSYKAIPWSRRTDHWAGVGVGEQVAMPQRLINAATRAWIDNAGHSAGPQIILDKLSIVPVDGKWVIHPWKLWGHSGESPIDDVAKAFQAISFPNVGAALEALVMYGFKLCEECSNIPLITQGQSGDSTPDTFGATQIQNTNANQMLRDVAENFDDHGTVPVVTDHYEWLLADPQVPNSAKGDYKIQAKGSSALVERHIQQQVVQGLIPLAVPGNVYGLDPRKIMEQYLRGNKLTPSLFKYSKEDQDRIDSTPPPKDIKLQVAELQAQIDKMRIEALTASGSELVQAKTAQTQQEHDAKMQELSLMVEKMKVDLATVTMKLQTQKELSAQDRTLDLHKHQNPPPVIAPPSEPAGEAQAGKAFEQ